MDNLGVTFQREKADYLDKANWPQIPGGAAGCYLLGRLHSLTDNPSTAISCYQAALLKNPLLWCAYEGLCQLGRQPAPGLASTASGCLGMSESIKALDWVAGHNEDAAAILRQAERDFGAAVHSPPSPHPPAAASPQDTVMRTPNSSLSADAPAFVPSPYGSVQWNAGPKSKADSQVNSLLTSWSRTLGS